jgi:hypothetical protein
VNVTSVNAVEKLRAWGIGTYKRPAARMIYDVGGVRREAVQLTQ